ncbi:hypothetical protein BT63DRAFT_139315 [Microthyrium microscopicum]|uniref:Uncharacterized protein n=1 Tax=Microthyrium microscopicum TaxID=703497 RepID=A0A6A6UM84_9PEZI|nr:hypothetical protein BT63DRAFT_139315 [Microthyrium microscopicum]
MSRTSVFNRDNQYAPKRGVADSNLRILRRSVRKIIHGLRADRVEGILEGIDELRFLTDWSTPNEKNGRYEKRHLDDEPSRKNRHTKNRHYECIGPVSHRKRQNNVSKRDVQDLGNGLLQEFLPFERCYHCRTSQRQAEPMERLVNTRLESTLTSKDLVINIHHHNYYYNQPSKPSSSNGSIERPRHSDIPRGITELPGEELKRNPEEAMLDHSHNLHERAPPTINETTKPSGSLVERVVRHKKHLGDIEAKQFTSGCRMRSERAAIRY